MKPVCLVSSVLLAVSPLAGAQAPPVEAFASLPTIQAPSISPDGTKLAFIAQADTGSFVLVSNIDTMAVTSAVDTSAFKPRDVNWANESTLLLLASETIDFGMQQRESVAPYGIDLDGDINIRQLLLGGDRSSAGARQVGGFRFMQGAQLIGYQRSTGLVLMPKFAQNADRVLHTLDAKNDRLRPVDTGSQFTQDWVVDENGSGI